MNLKDLIIFGEEQLDKKARIVKRGKEGSSCYLLLNKEIKELFRKNKNDVKYNVISSNKNKFLVVKLK